MDKLLEIHSVGVILRQSSPNLKDFYLKAKDNFEKEGIKVYLEKNSAIMIDDDSGVDFDKLCKKSDILASIGGDGTLLAVARSSFKYDKPILGVNLGTLGFLTDINPNELDKFILNLKNNQYRIDKRMMIEVRIGLNSYVAFNDIVMTRKSILNMVNIDAKIDNKKFNSYYGDGLIISTPTGSSAYNLSCGGPVVYPLTDAFIVTPISPHSLTQRPLILPVEFEIELSTADIAGAIIIIDGQDIYEVSKDESVKIKISEKRINLIHRVERNYFEVLSEKLNWGK